MDIQEMLMGGGGSLRGRKHRTRRPLGISELLSGGDNPATTTQPQLENTDEFSTLPRNMKFHGSPELKAGSSSSSRSHGGGQTSAITVNGQDRNNNNQSNGHLTGTSTVWNSQSQSSAQENGDREETEEERRERFRRNLKYHRQQSGSGDNTGQEPLLSPLAISPRKTVRFILDQDEDLSHRSSKNKSGDTSPAPRTQNSGSDEQPSPLPKVTQNGGTDALSGLFKHRPRKPTPFSGLHSVSSTGTDDTCRSGATNGAQSNADMELSSETERTMSLGTAKKKSPPPPVPPKPLKKMLTGTEPLSDVDPSEVKNSETKKWPFNPGSFEPSPDPAPAEEDMSLDDMLASAGDIIDAMLASKSSSLSPKGTTSPVKIPSPVPKRETQPAQNGEARSVPVQETASDAGQTRGTIPPPSYHQVVQNRSAYVVDPSTGLAGNEALPPQPVSAEVAHSQQLLSPLSPNQDACDFKLRRLVPRKPNMMLFGPDAGQMLAAGSQVPDPLLAAASPVLPTDYQPSLPQGQAVGVVQAAPVHQSYSGIGDMSSVGYSSQPAGPHTGGYSVLQQQQQQRPSTGAAPQYETILPHSTPGLLQAGYMTDSAGHVILPCNVVHNPQGLATGLAYVPQPNPSIVYPSPPPVQAPLHVNTGLPQLSVVCPPSPGIANHSNVSPVSRPLLSQSVSPARSMGDNRLHSSLQSAPGHVAMTMQGMPSLSPGIPLVVNDNHGLSEHSSTSPVMRVPMERQSHPAMLSPADKVYPPSVLTTAQSPERNEHFSLEKRVNNKDVQEERESYFDVINSGVRTKDILYSDQYPACAEITTHGITEKTPMKGTNSERSISPTKVDSKTPHTEAQTEAEKIKQKNETGKLGKFLGTIGTPVNAESGNLKRSPEQTGSSPEHSLPGTSPELIHKENVEQAKELKLRDQGLVHQWLGTVGGTSLDRDKSVLEQNSIGPHVQNSEQSSPKVTAQGPVMASDSTPKGYHWKKTDIHADASPKVLSEETKSHSEAPHKETVAKPELTPKTGCDKPKDYHWHRTDIHVDKDCDDFQGTTAKPKTGTSQENPCDNVSRMTQNVAKTTAPVVTTSPSTSTEPKDYHWRKTDIHADFDRDEESEVKVEHPVIGHSVPAQSPSDKVTMVTDKQSSAISHPEHQAVDLIPVHIGSSSSGQSQQGVAVVNRISETPDLLCCQGNTAVKSDLDTGLLGHHLHRTTDPVRNNQQQHLLKQAGQKDSGIPGQALDLNAQSEMLLAEEKEPLPGKVVPAGITSSQSPDMLSVLYPGTIERKRVRHRSTDHKSLQMMFDDIKKEVAEKICFCAGNHSHSQAPATCYCCAKNMHAIVIPGVGHGQPTTGNQAVRPSPTRSKSLEKEVPVRKPVPEPSTDTSPTQQSPQEGRTLYDKVNQNKYSWKSTNADGGFKAAEESPTKAASPTQSSQSGSPPSESGSLVDEVPVVKKAEDIPSPTPDQKTWWEQSQSLCAPSTVTPQPRTHTPVTKSNSVAGYLRGTSDTGLVHRIFSRRPASAGSGGKQQGSSFRGHRYGSQEVSSGNLSGRSTPESFRSADRISRTRRWAVGQRDRALSDDGGRRSPDSISSCDSTPVRQPQPQRRPHNRSRSEDREAIAVSGSESDSGMERAWRQYAKTMAAETANPPAGHNTVTVKVPGKTSKPQNRLENSPLLTGGEELDQTFARLDAWQQSMESSGKAKSGHQNLSSSPDRARGQYAWSPAVQGEGLDDAFEKLEHLLGNSPSRHDRSRRRSNQSSVDSDQEYSYLEAMVTLGDTGDQDLTADMDIDLTVPYQANTEQQSTQNVRKKLFSDLERENVAVDYDSGSNVTSPDSPPGRPGTFSPYSDDVFAARSSSPSTVSTSSGPSERGFRRRSSSLGGDSPQPRKSLIPLPVSSVNSTASKYC